MKCADCGATVTQDDDDEVRDSFDFDCVYCLPCAAEQWKEEQISRAGNGGIPQDEDSPTLPSVK